LHLKSESHSGGHDIVAMSYRFLQSEEGNLESVVDNTSTVMVELLSCASEDCSGKVPMLDCSDKVLAELHEFMQHGVNMLKGHQDDDMSVDYDDDETSPEEGSSKGGGEWFDSKQFIRHLLERMTKAKSLLEEEGVVQVDVLKLAQELSDQCQAIDQGDIKASQIEALLAQVGQLLRTVRPVDLDLLLELLQAGQDSGDTMQDKDVLLLIGSTGSGKTSTIHYLAGSTFEEIIVRGFDHLQILNVAHPALRKAKTSSSTRSVTRSIQMIDITTESGETLVICDSPGFDDTDGAEVNIANGFRLVRAVHRAKRVKPVLVLSKNGIGDRFGAVSQVLRTITRLVGAGAGAPVDPTPFAYAFTKYDEKYADRLYKQFRQKYKELTDAEREDRSFTAFVFDISQKTKPVATIVTLLNEDNRASLLSSLMEGEWYEDPKTSFSDFVSESSLDKLNFQLQLTVKTIHVALDRKDASLVMTKLLQLDELGDRLPHGAVFAKDGVDSVLDFLGTCKESLSSCIEKCSKLHENASVFKQELRSAREMVMVLVDFHPISKKWMSELSVGSDFCVQSIDILMNGLEEVVFCHRGNMAHFISELRQHISRLQSRV